jgi:hypothetical protein
MFHSLRGAVRHVDFIESLDSGLESIVGGLGGFATTPGGVDLVYIIRIHDPCEQRTMMRNIPCVDQFTPTKPTHQTNRRSGMDHAQKATIGGCHM